MRLSVTVSTGFSLGPWRKDMLRRVKRAALRATDKASIGAQEDIRRAMRGQRLGGLANAVKQTSDLKKNRIRELPGGGFSASGVVYAHIRSERTKGAFDAYTEGATILPKRGRWLAIATNEIPRRVGRYKMTPKRYVEGGFESRIGPLRFIPSSRGNVAYLVADNVTTSPFRSGSARRLPKSGRARAGRQHVGIVAFVLIRQTKRTKRFDPQHLAQRWQQKIAFLIAREMT